MNKKLVGSTDQEKAYNLFSKTFELTEMEISNIFSELPYGKYILQMMLTETRTTQTEGVYKRVNSHDRYISRGKITSAYSTDDNNSIMIEDKINII